MKRQLKRAGFNQAQELRNIGLKKCQIAKILKVADSTVWHWLASNNWEEYQKKNKARHEKYKKPQPKIEVKEEKYKLEEMINLNHLENQVDKISKEVETLKGMLTKSAYKIMEESK